MKWFIIVTFLNSATPSSSLHNMYVFSKPIFNEQYECFEYVRHKNQEIYNMAASSYDFKLQPKAIYCLDETSVKVILNEYKNYLYKKDKKST